MGYLEARWRHAGIHSGPAKVAEELESGIRSASLLGEVPVVDAPSIGTQAQPEVEIVRVFPNVNVDRPLERVREGEVQQGENSGTFGEGALRQVQISVGRVTYDEALWQERVTEPQVQPMLSWYRRLP